MKTVKKYLSGSKKDVFLILEMPVNELTVSTFHKLRVEIKKINAFLDLLNFCAKNFKKREIFKPFKLIFDQAGKVRAIQVEENMLESYFAKDSIKNYKLKLRNKYQMEYEKFCSIVNKKNLRSIRKSYSIIKHFTNQVVKKKILKYVENKKKVIEKILEESLTNKSLFHELRRETKTLYYNMKMLHIESQPQRFRLKTDTYLDLLGRQRDIEITVKHLKNEIDCSETSRKERAEIKKISSIISCEGDKLVEKIKAQKHINV